MKLQKYYSQNLPRNNTLALLLMNVSVFPLVHPDRLLSNAELFLRSVLLMIRYLISKYGNINNSSSPKFSSSFAPHPDFSLQMLYVF